MIEKKIYSCWAFSEDEIEKGNMNFKIYNELINKYKVFRSHSNLDLEDRVDCAFQDYDVVIGGRGEYLKSRYYIYKNTCNLSENELALLCDQGNLCFGYVTHGDNTFIVYED